MPNDYRPDVVIADTQQLEDNDWDACVLLVKMGKCEVQVGLYRPDTKYFLRLLSYVSSEGIDPESAGIALRHVFSEHSIEPGKCRNVRFIVDTPLYTVIPEALYDNKLQEEYFSFLFKAEENQVLHTDKLDSLALIYPVDRIFFEEMSEYPNFSVIHNQTVLLNSRENKENGPMIYVTLQPKNVCIAVYSGNDLLLAQSYRIAGSIDVVYHISNVVQRLKLPETVELCLTGTNEWTGEVLEKLQNRFDQTRWLQRPEGCQFPGGIDQYPAHYFYHLVSLALCES